jgi:Plasmid replication region DNA-binding N-term
MPRLVCDLERRRHAPAFPRVAIRDAQPGRITTTDELNRLGLVAPPETVAQPLRVHAPRLPDDRRWPSYARCLDGAPLNSEETGPVVSEEDVIQAAQALLARGERVTGQAIREEIGHGDRARFIRIWNGGAPARPNAAQITELRRRVAQR